MHVDKHTAAKATVILAGSAAALVLGAALLAMLGRGGGGAGLTAASYDQIAAKARDRVSNGTGAESGEAAPEPGDVYLEAIAARLAMATDIPLAPPEPEEEDEPEETEPAEPRLTPEEVARRRAERERELMEQQPSVFRYLGRLRLGTKSVALLATEAGQTAIAEGRTAQVRLKDQTAHVKIVSIEDARVELIEAVTDNTGGVDLEAVGIRRTLERASRSNSIVSASPEASSGSSSGGSAGRGFSSRSGNDSGANANGRGAQGRDRRGRGQGDDRAELSSAEQQRRLELQRTLGDLGFRLTGSPNARDLRVLEGLARNLEQAIENRPDPADFEGGASSQEYRDQFGNWNRGVENLRDRIRDTIDQG